MTARFAAFLIALIFLATAADNSGAAPATVTLGSVAYVGELEIELGGTTAGSFDRLEHTLGAGLAQLGGALSVSLINGYVPTLGDSFEFLIASGGVNGTFASQTFPTLPGGLGWNVNYGANSVALQVTAVPSFSADFDSDGDVDGDDLAEWRNDFGGAAGSDADGDNDSDGNDFLAWQQQDGSGAMVVAGTAVPEPVGFAAIVTAIAGIAAFRSSRRPPID